MKGWELFNHPMTEYEKKVVPLVVAILWERWERENAIKCRGVIALLKSDAKAKEIDVKICPARLRAILHFIRTTGIIPNLVATGGGYYRTNNVEKLKEYSDSLLHREGTIANVRKAIETYIFNIGGGLA